MNTERPVVALMSNRPDEILPNESIALPAPPLFRKTVKPFAVRLPAGGLNPCAAGCGLEARETRPLELI
jgi:hypothetical protein